MKQITAVTTFHQAGLDMYGQRFLDSFAKNVDKKIKLFVYTEDCNPVNPDPNQIIILDQRQHLPELMSFKKRWKDEPKANGKCPFPKLRPADYHKEFKWDAVRFSNKVYSVFDACSKVNDWCVWMDADMYVHSPWNYKDFANLFPDTHWITYVGRGKSSMTWPECGFYGLNLNNQTCVEFLKEFKKMYNNAESGIFTLPEWHDSYVFGHILNKMKRLSPNAFDYTSAIVLSSAKTGGGGHPLINTELGKWLDHLKGDRKKLKKSKKTDISVNRKEDYWK